MPTTTYASAIAWHPNGKLSALTRGNGNVYSQTLNARQLPEHIGSYGELLHHTYFADGKLSGINALNNARDRIFTYDGAGRLDAAAGPWGVSGNVWGYYEYDPLGNLTQKQLDSRVVDIEYTSLNRVNRVRDSAVSANWRVYNHDARGNVTSDGIHGFVYDFANQPISISGADTGSYSYDGHLKRVKEVVGGQTIYSIYDRSGALLTRDNATTVTKTDYLSIGGQTFVRIKNNVASYPFNDHLGTALMVADQSGSIPASQVFNYTPFGESVGANDPGDANEQGYTGHIEDITGLTYMQARYYDPIIGRFLATDPMGYLDQLNLYAYVANDPVNSTDPTGMVCYSMAAVMGSTCDFTGGVPMLAYDRPNSRSSGQANSDDLQHAALEQDEDNDQIVDDLIVGVGWALIAVDILNSPVSPIPDVGLIGAGMIGGVRAARGIAPQIAKIEKQLAQHGRASVERSLRSLENRLAKHRQDLEIYRAQGGFTSSVEREMRAFETEIQAIKEVLGRGS